MDDLRFKKYTYPVICLMGPTASRKTELAIALSQNFPVKIISVDSALIYRGMDIGTAKPTVEELVLAPHQLINIRDPSELYSVSDFCYDAHKAIKDSIFANRIPLLVGGSMFYFKSLLDGLSLLPKKNDAIRKCIIHEAELSGWMNVYKKLQKIDPISAKRIHCSDHKRLLRALEVFYISKKTLTELIQTSSKRLLLDYSFFLFAIKPLDRMLLHECIKNRFYRMLDMGFENEVKKLFFRSDMHENMSSISCIGYRQMWLYLSEKISYNDMVFKCICATRQLAKHQMTWLRKWSGIYWLSSDCSIFDWMNEIDRIVRLVKFK